MRPNTVGFEIADVEVRNCSTLYTSPDRLRLTPRKPFDRKPCITSLLVNWWVLGVVRSHALTGPDHGPETEGSSGRVISRFRASSRRHCTMLLPSWLLGTADSAGQSHCIIRVGVRLQSAEGVNREDVAVNVYKMRAVNRLARICMQPTEYGQ